MATTNNTEPGSTDENGPIVPPGLSELIARVDKLASSLRANPSQLERERLVEEFFRAAILAHECLSSWPQEKRPKQELKQWALRQHTEEEIVAGLKEARANGGPELVSLIKEFEQGL